MVDLKNNYHSIKNNKCSELTVFYLNTSIFLLNMKIMFELSNMQE